MIILKSILISIVTFLLLIECLFLAIMLPLYILIILLASFMVGGLYYMYEREAIE